MNFVHQQLCPYGVETTKEFLLRIKVYFLYLHTGETFTGVYSQRSLQPPTKKKYRWALVILFFWPHLMACAIVAPQLGVESGLSAVTM